MTASAQVYDASIFSIFFKPTVKCYVYREIADYEIRKHRERLYAEYGVDGVCISEIDETASSEQKKRGEHSENDADRRRDQSEYVAFP